MRRRMHYRQDTRPWQGWHENELERMEKACLSDGDPSGWLPSIREEQQRRRASAALATGKSEAGSGDPT